MLSQWLADIVMKRYVIYWAYCFHWKTLKAKYPRDILLTAVVTYHYSCTVFLPNRRRRVDAILQLNFHCHSRWHGILCILRKSVHTGREAECSLNLIISFGQSVFVFPVKYHNYVVIFQDCTPRVHEWPFWTSYIKVIPLKLFYYQTFFENCGWHCPVKRERGCSSWRGM